jgi:hypothetical protein
MYSPTVKMYLDFKTLMNYINLGSGEQLTITTAVELNVSGEERFEVTIPIDCISGKKGGFFSMDEFYLRKP